MSLTLRNGHATAPSRYLVRDPFDMARELFGWDPFVPVRKASALGARPAIAFSPAFEVKETSEAFVLKADLPGVTESDLEIAVHDDVLTVSGRRQAEEAREGERYALDERPFGAFSRSFSLPDLADGERVEAKLESGVLTLAIAKKLEAKPRKIALTKRA